MTPGQEQVLHDLIAAQAAVNGVDLRRFPGARWEALRREVWEVRETVAELVDGLSEQAALDAWVERRRAERRAMLPGLAGDR